MNKKRCAWVNPKNPDYLKYHDTEWGVPVHNDKKLFEMLILEGAQAGLSWETVLKKRSAYKKAFDNWDFNKIAKFDFKKEKVLLKNPDLIRNRLKIKSTIQNARVFIQIRKEFKTFDNYIWQFVDRKIIQNKFKKLSDLPTQTNISEKISKDLKKRGMNFVGPTIIYAFMQAIGMVNDHEVGCFRHQEVLELTNKK